MQQGPARALRFRLMAANGNGRDGADPRVGVEEGDERRPEVAALTECGVATVPPGNGICDGRASLEIDPQKNS